jgi:hypothetical protein
MIHAAQCTLVIAPYEFCDQPGIRIDCSLASHQTFTFANSEGVILLVTITQGKMQGYFSAALLGVVNRMPPPQSIEEFRLTLQSGEPAELAHRFVLADAVHAIPAADKYRAFREKVRNYLPAAEYVAIVGSGNWRYSLNPNKLLNEYHQKSDIDVAVVSAHLYQETWDEMRRFHRDRWYALGYDARSRLTRNGQNVYAGFACPSWLPQVGHPHVYGFKSMLSKLSGPEVGYREVKMLYFKNETEMIDYYRRGFADAKRELDQ